MSQYDGFKEYESVGYGLGRSPDHPESFFWPGHPCCRNGYRKLVTFADLQEALKEIQYQKNDRLRGNMAGSLLVEYINNSYVSELYYAARRPKRPSFNPFRKLRRKLPMPIKLVLNGWIAKLYGINNKPQE
jgi:hypothetical protein